MSKKEIKKFDKDPLKWVAKHIGVEIELPKQKKPKHRWFLVRFDAPDPNFCEEVEYKTLEKIMLEGANWIEAKKFIQWINGGKI